MFSLVRGSQEEKVLPCSKCWCDKKVQESVVEPGGTETLRWGKGNTAGKADKGAVLDNRSPS